MWYVERTTWYREGYITVIEAGPMSESDAINKKHLLNGSAVLSNAFYEAISEEYLKKLTEDNQLNVLITYRTYNVPDPIAL